MTENFMSVSNAPLTDVQIVEMILFYCISRSDTNPIAHRLLDRFGSIESILRAEESELSSVFGMGNASAKTLKRIRNAFFRYRELSHSLHRNSRLTKKTVCDGILSALRDSAFGLRETPPFMILCFSDSGKIVSVQYFSKVTAETLHSFSAAHSKNESTVVFCVSDACIDLDEVAKKEFLSIESKTFSKCNINVIAHITKELTVKFTVIQ